MEAEKFELVKKDFNLDEALVFMKRNTRPMEEMYTRYECALMEVETKFRVLNAQLSLIYDGNPIENIKTRLKSKESLIRKMQSKNLPFTIEAAEKNITDIAGIRVICSFTEDIYVMEKSLLRQDDVTLIAKKDYIKSPKPNGYRSLHLIVEVPIFLKDETRKMKVEIQFRTIAMDFWASLEHKLRYKKKRTELQEEKIANELLECANTSALLDTKMQGLRHYLNEEI